MRGVFGGSPSTDPINSGISQTSNPNTRSQEGFAGQEHIQTQSQQPAQTTQEYGYPSLGKPGQPGSIDTQIQTNADRAYSREEVVERLATIGQVLGKEVDTGFVESLSDEELRQEYIEAQKELESIGEIERTRQENNMLKQELDAVKNYIQFFNFMPQQGNENYRPYMGQVPSTAHQPYLQQQNYMPSYQPIEQYSPNPYQQPRDEFGRFVSPTVQPQMDLDKFWDDFNEKGPEALKPIISHEVQQAIAMQREQIRQLEQIVHEQHRQNQLQQYFATQIQGLQQKYGAEFDLYRPTIARIIDEKKHYAVLPNGLELAFQEAKQMAGTYNQQQQYMHQQLSQQEAAKFAAQMTSSNGVYEMPQQPRYFDHTPRKGRLG